MQSKDPYKLNEINFDNIVYGKIKENSKKKVIYVKYQHKNLLNNLVFQLPTLLYNNSKIKEDNYYELEFPISCKNKENEDVILNFFDKLNNKIIDDAKMNSSQWFGNITSSKYQNFIRTTDNKNFKKGSLRLKILKTPDFETILKINNKKVKVENIPELCWCKVLVEFYAIWINKNGFGGYLRPVLMYFKELSKTEYNYHLLDDSEEIDDIPGVESVFIKQTNTEKKILKFSIIDSLALNDNLSSSSEKSLEEILSSQTN